MTISSSLTTAVKKIGRREAVLLLCHITGLSHSDILLRGDTEITEAQEKILQELIRKRADGEPLQYLLKRWPFYGLEMAVDTRALIPRPETELLVEAVLNYVKNVTPLTLLDICTGSGCIGISLAKNADIQVTAADISKEALSLAEENAKRHGVINRFHLIHSDLFANIPLGEFDIIVSNPPYIFSGDIKNLDKGITDYEPLIALDGGADGLDIYHRLIPQSIQYLRPGGALFLEIGPREGVTECMERAGFTDITVWNDYAGLPRIVYGKTIGRH